LSRDKVTRQEDLLRAFFLGLQDDDARVYVELNKEPKSIDEAVYHVINYAETSSYHFRQQLLQFTFLYENIVRFYLPT
jgi:predicted transcriptional regulator